MTPAQQPDRPRRIDDLWGDRTPYGPVPPWPDDLRRGAAPGDGVVSGAEPAPDRHLLDRTRIVLRPLASPLPLGLFAFALGSLVLGVSQLGAFGPGGGDPVVTTMLSVYVALPQLVAAVIAFLTREGTVATLLVLAAMTWPANLAVLTAAPGTTTSASRGVL